jgi:hypothetical protein
VPNDVRLRVLASASTRGALTVISLSGYENHFGLLAFRVPVDGSRDSHPLGLDLTLVWRGSTDRASITVHCRVATGSSLRLVIFDCSGAMFCSGRFATILLHRM